MQIIMRAVAVGITGSVLAVLLKKNVPELSLVISLTAGLLCAALSLGICAEITDTLSSLASRSGISLTLLTPVVKCVGIGIVTELGSRLCKDAGQGTIASFLELCGTLCALFSALPLFRSLSSVVEELI